MLWTIVMLISVAPGVGENLFSGLTCGLSRSPLTMRRARGQLLCLQKMKNISKDISDGRVWDKFSAKRRQWEQ